MKQELTFDFGPITFQDQRLSEKQKVENKMVLKIKKHRFKYSKKMLNDINVIKSLIHRMGPDEEIALISKSFDSPSILLTFKDDIKKLYVATWSITPAGISALEAIVNNGIVEEIYVMLDLTHSYKWLFASDAYQILKDKVKFKFLATHAKYICFELSDGRVYNFIGSMNLSNNPRFENIQITQDRDDYNFYTSFVKGTEGRLI